MMKYLAPNVSAPGNPKPTQPTPTATQASSIPSPVTATPEQVMTHSSIAAFLATDL